MRSRDDGSTDPRLWVKVDLGARGQIGPGKIALLRAIDAQASIAAAARTLGMSYKRAWDLVGQLNETAGAAVVETRVGGADRGGAALTELGRRVVAQYDRLLASAQAGGAEDLAALDNLLSGDGG
ncbi:MAG: LysR family transcriptional regulator [Alphaproteobacteria bacterium]